MWNDGKREKWFDNKEEFINLLKTGDDNFSFVFQWSKTKLINFMEIDNDKGE